MKKRIEQLINGKLECDFPELILSEDIIKVTTLPGENYRGELMIKAANHTVIKGAVLSSHRRLVLGKNHFSGNHVRIPYGFEVTGLKSEDVCEGVLTVSTNIGEKVIPFVLTIKEEHLETTRGDVKDVETFIALAKEDYREAFQVFTNPEFPSVLKGKEEIHRGLYQALAKNPVTYQHLEEFLIGIQGKEKVTFSLEEHKKVFSDITSSTKSELILHKSNWGYLRIEVQIISDFLSVEKHVITSDDFIGSIYPLEYIIKKDKLSKGKRISKIILKSVYQTEVLEVQASLMGHQGVNIRVFGKEQDYKLFREYLQYKMSELDQETWYFRGISRLEEAKSSGNFTEFHKLYQVYLHLENGYKDKAKRLLDGWSTREFSKEEYLLEGIYLFLDGCAKGAIGGQIHVHEQLLELYRHHQEQFVLLGLLLKVDEDLQKIPLKKLFMLERQYEMGCRSPFLYLEAYNTMKEDVTTLRKLSSFSLQVLLFAKKYGLLSKEIIMRAGYLTQYEKEFHKPIYEILDYGYEKCKSTELLEAICKYIMKGNPGKKSYFKWYERGVECDLRITRLYEYYIETMEETYQKKFPKAVRLYFLYNNTLSDKKKAYVYANIIMNKKNDEKTYEAYVGIMEQFAYRKLKEGRFNHNFAILYQELIGNLQDEKVLNSFGHLAFSYKLCCDAPNIRKIIVYHEELEEELEFPLVDKVAYIACFTKNAKIIFEDEKKRRYASTIPYSLEKVISEEKVIKEVKYQLVWDTGLLLHLTKEVLDLQKMDEDNVCLYQRCLQSEEISLGYKDKVRKALLDYYREGGKDRNLQGFLSRLDVKEIPTKERPLYMEVLISNCYFDKAFDLICTYGYERIDFIRLEELCSYKIRMIGDCEEEELLYLASYLFFQSSYDEDIIKYLLKYFEGNCKEFDELFITAQSLGLDTFEFTERVLIYSMYVGSYLEQGLDMLSIYRSKLGNEKILQAYENFESYGYVIEKRKFHEDFFCYLEERLKEEGNLSRVSQLALLKMYVDEEELRQGKEEVIDQLLKECNQKGLRFGFFQKLPKEYLVPYQLMDRVFIEYKSKTKDLVFLHYRLVTKKGGNSETIVKSMPRLFEGIFAKEFVLFYGEELHYYFEVIRDGCSTFTKEEVIKKTEAPSNHNSKYELLNRLIMTRDAEDLEGFDQLIKQYAFFEHLGELTSFGGQEDE